MLRKYEECLPGTAERIPKSFEREGEHRQLLERTIIAAQIESEKRDGFEAHRGQTFGFVLGAIGLLIGGAVALFSRSDGGSVAGGIISGTTLVGLVTAFIVGRRRLAQEEEQEEPSTSLRSQSP